MQISIVIEVLAMPLFSQLPVPVRATFSPDFDLDVSLRTQSSIQYANRFLNVNLVEKTNEDAVPDALNNLLRTVDRSVRRTTRSRVSASFTFTYVDLICLVPAINFPQTGVVYKIKLLDFISCMMRVTQPNSAYIPYRFLNSRLILDIRSDTNPNVQLSHASSVILSRWDRMPTNILNPTLQSQHTQQIDNQSVEQSPVRSPSIMENMINRVEDIEHLERQSLRTNIVEGTRVQRRIDPNITNCMICFGTGQKSNFITSSCNRHYMCLDCLKEYMSQPSYNHPINNLGKKFICPFDGCRGIFNLSKVFDKLDEETQKKLNDHLNSLPETCGFPYTCGNCDHVNFLDLTDPGNQNEPINCQRCRHDICKNCCSTDHCECPIQGWVNGPLYIEQPGGTAESLVLRSGNYIPKYVIQKKDFTTEIAISSLQKLLLDPMPFKCSCSHCGCMLERSEACTELKHCNISTCSLCGFKAKPGETQIHASHWNECFRYEEDLFEHIKVPYQLLNHARLTTILSSLRLSLHVIRLFKFLTMRQKNLCRDLMNDWVALGMVDVQNFENFQYGLILLRWGYPVVTAASNNLVSLNMMVEASMEFLVDHTNRLIPSFEYDSMDDDTESDASMPPLEPQQPYPSILDPNIADHPNATILFRHIEPPLTTPPRPQTTIHSYTNVSHPPQS